MKSSDWLNRWRQNRIGFHESGVNAYLQQFLSEFGLKPGDKIFIPLCGKAHDIAWLAQQGFEVIGVELSDFAIESFFHEQKLVCKQFESDQFLIRKSGSISIYQGDFFNIPRDVLAECKLVYDRASLIAFDRVNRECYCDYLQSIVPSMADMLLITLDYDQSQMSGPPFAVSQAEINGYYRSNYSISELERNDVLDERPRWRDQGLTALTETVFHLKRRNQV